MRLDKWQEEILNAKGHVLLCTGRQVGKTTIFARKAAEYMISFPGSSIIVVSLTEDQAQLMIIMVLDYLQRKERETKTKIVGPGQSSKTKNKIILRNKSQILARPVGNTGDAVRGFTANVLIIDEASRMPELMWTAAMPTLATTSGEIWMCSTPFGKQGYFWDCFNNAQLKKSEMYKVFYVNTWDVYHDRPIADDWTEIKKKRAIEFLEEQKKTMSTLQFGQEYLGLFVEDLARFISDEIIEKACVLKSRAVHITGREYYLGLDVARMGGDEIAFEGLDKIDDKHIEQIQNDVEKNKPLTWTAEMVITYNRLYNYQKIGIDTTGVGSGVFDILYAEDSTKRKIVSIENAQKPIEYHWDKEKTKRLMKEEMYLNLRTMLEKGYLKLFNDDNVKLSLRSLQEAYEISDSGTTRYRIFGNYTHIVEGLIRAAWLAKEKVNKLVIDYI